MQKKVDFHRDRFLSAMSQSCQWYVLFTERVLSPLSKLILSRNASILRLFSSGVKCIREFSNMYAKNTQKITQHNCKLHFLHDSFPSPIPRSGQYYVLLLARMLSPPGEVIFSLNSPDLMLFSCLKYAIT